MPGDGSRGPADPPEDPGELKVRSSDDQEFLQGSPGVTGVAVITKDGIPLHTTLDDHTTVQYGGLVSQLSNKARSIVKEMDKKNDLTCIRVMSTKYEVSERREGKCFDLMFSISNS